MKPYSVICRQPDIQAYHEKGGAKVQIGPSLLDHEN